jgi:hypothetical protein
MTSRRITFAIPLVALLFVGSGCETSDVLDILEITHDISPAESAGGVFGVSTGDKAKDAVLDSVNTMNDIKKAKELEDEAAEALSKKPTDYETANKNLQAALKLRPTDWSLKNQQMITQAELGGVTPTLNHPAHLCPEDERGDVQNRCLFGSIKERTALLAASVARQKQNDQLISCATQETMHRHYEFLGRLVPDELAKLGYTEEQAEEFRLKAIAAEAAAKSPGVTCRR